MRLFFKYMALSGILLMMGCSTIKYVPVKEIEYVTVTQTETVRDTLIQYQVEKEYVRDYTGLLDTLALSTSYADAYAWVDTTANSLKGEIKNREKVIDVPVSIKEKVVYRDSIAYKDVPVPVEVEIIKTKYPAIFWWLLGWCILSIGYVSIRVYFKMQIPK